MDEQIKKLQQAMNDYLVRTHADKKIIYKNLSLFYSLACNIEEGLFECFNLNDELIDYNKIAKITSTDKINLIQKFYEHIGVEFDINKFISDGTIDFVYYDFFNDNDDLESTKFNHMASGSNAYEGSKKTISIPNTGLITDIMITVHEISHLRDQPDDRRNQTNDLLTEALAYTEELICVDYLSKIGYKEEMKFWKKTLFNTFYTIAANIRPIYKLFLLYKELGSISLENYEYYFKNDREYEQIIDYMSDLSKNQSFNLYYKSWYVMGAVLSTFMYTEYKKDNNYSKIILELHSLINEASTLECFKKIGIQDFNKEDKVKILKSLEEVKKELKENEGNKTTNISK